MNDDVSAAPLIDPDYAAFMRLGVSVIVSSRNAENRPCVVRGIGCRLSADRRTVRVFFAGSQAPALLAAIRATRTIAVALSQPTTFRTIQLKSNAAHVVAPEEPDREAVRSNRQLFADEIAQLGHKRTFAHALHDSGREDLIAIEFAPNAIFEQTPGPGAGRAL